MLSFLHWKCLLIFIYFTFYTLIINYAVVLCGSLNSCLNENRKRSSYCVHTHSNAYTNTLACDYHLCLCVHTQTSILVGFADKQWWQLLPWQHHCAPSPFPLSPTNPPPTLVLAGSVLGSAVEGGLKTRDRHFFSHRGVDRKRRGTKI